MRGMRKITGKSTSRSGVALLTGADNIGMTQVRCRIGHRKDIMRSVAVITFCRLHISELGNFSVVCIKICFRDFFVTPAARVHDVQLESLLIGPLDGMGCMTIIADRKWF